MLHAQGVRWHRLLVAWCCLTSWYEGTASPEAASNAGATQISETTTLTTTPGPLEVIVGVYFRLSVIPEAEGDLAYAGRIRIRLASDGAACGDAWSSLMTPAVQPECAGNVCASPTERRITERGVELAWPGVRIVRPGMYRVCWCEPRPDCAGPDAGYGYTGPGCCHHDADFSTHVGEIDVWAPDWESYWPLLGEPVELMTLQGSDLLDSPRVQLRVRVIPFGSCGGARSDQDMQAAEVVEEHVSGTPSSRVVALVGRTFRKLPFVICWCPGSQLSPEHGDCLTDEDFPGEVGEVVPRGPETEDVEPHRAIAGVAFEVMLGGGDLSYRDRLLIASGDATCGTEGAGYSPVVMHQVCVRDRPCEYSPVFHSPPTLVAPDSRWEVWEPAAVYSLGVYHICWCSDTSWDQNTGYSRGLCATNDRFDVVVGSLIVDGIPAQFFRCSSFSSCALEVHGSGPFSLSDAILIVSPREAFGWCGRGQDGIRMPATSLRSVNGTSSSGWNHSGTFHVIPHTGLPGLFQLCYCNSSAMGECDMDTAFGQYAGELEVGAGDGSDNGTALLEDVYICGAGRACTLSFAGTWAMQVHYNDAFSAIPTEDECGSGSARVQSMFTFDWQTQLVDGMMYAYFSLTSRGMYSAGDYRLCYCSASLLPSRSCELESDFIVQAGRLQVVGAQHESVWHCRQGADCEATIPVWRASAEDAIRVVVGDHCVSTVGIAAQLAVGFAHNPSTEPNIGNVSNQTLTAASLVNFSFGQSFGAGTWRVCLCMSALSSVRGCAKPEDFQQYVGMVGVEGPLMSLAPHSSMPATLSFVSAVVDIAVPTTLTCGASDRTFVAPNGTTPPTNYDIAACSDQIPGCIGMEGISKTLPAGLFVIHVPVKFPEGVIADEVVAHLWCMARESCYTGMCVEPPTVEGLVQTVRPGVQPWTNWWMVRSTPYDFVLRGDPINPLGLLRVVPEGRYCEDSRNSVFGGTASGAEESYALVWHGVRLDYAGNHHVCWCDRTDGSRCPAWQIVGHLLVSGPTTMASTVPLVGVGEVFEVFLSGIGLSAADRLVAVSFATGGCSEAEALNSSAPRWVDGTAARWNVSAPWQYGDFFVCWGHAPRFSTIVGTGTVQESQDCQLSDWESPEDPGCSRQCGGGYYEEMRTILVPPVGSGHPCPPVEELARQVPCNTQPCPEAVVNTSWTHPPHVYVDEPFLVLVSGENLRPAEDRVLLLPSEYECGHGVWHAGGAACSASGSRSDRLICGDGIHSLKVDKLGLFRVCVCAASAYSGWSSQNCTGGMEAYTVTPAAGGLIEVLAVADHGGVDGGSSEGSEGSGDVGEPGIDDASTDGGAHGDVGAGGDNIINATATEVLPTEALPTDSLPTEPLPRPGQYVGSTLYPVPEHVVIPSEGTEQDSKEDGILYNPFAMGGFAALAVPISLAFCVVPVWYREKRRRRVTKIAHTPTPVELEEDDEDDIVKKATKHAWESYARTLTQHFYGLEVESESEQQACEIGENQPEGIADEARRPDSGTTASTEVPSRPGSRRSVISEAPNEGAADGGDDEHRTTPGWGSPRLQHSSTTPAAATPLPSRPCTSRTPPRTPVLSRPGTARTNLRTPVSRAGTSRPCTNASGSTTVSKYSSFLRVDLSEPGTPIRPSLSTGGAFTHIPLMGAQPPQAEVAAVAAAAASTSDTVFEPAKPECEQHGVALKRSSTPPFAPEGRRTSVLKRPELPPLILPPHVAAQPMVSTPLAGAASAAHSDEIIRLAAQKLEALVSIAPEVGTASGHTSSTARPPGSTLLSVELGAPDLLRLPPPPKYKPAQPPSEPALALDGAPSALPHAVRVRSELRPCPHVPASPRVAGLGLSEERLPDPRLCSTPVAPPLFAEPALLPGSPQNVPPDGTTFLQMPPEPPPTRPATQALPPKASPSLPPPLSIPADRSVERTQTSQTAVSFPASAAGRPSPSQRTCVSAEGLAEVPLPPPQSHPGSDPAGLEILGDRSSVGAAASSTPSPYPPESSERPGKVSRVATQPSVLGRLTAFVTGPWWGRRQLSPSPRLPPAPAGDPPLVCVDEEPVPLPSSERRESFEESIAKLLAGDAAASLPGCPVTEQPLSPAHPADGLLGLDEELPPWHNPLDAKHSEAEKPPQAQGQQTPPPPRERPQGLQAHRHPAQNPEMAQERNLMQLVEPGVDEPFLPSRPPPVPPTPVPSAPRGRPEVLPLHQHPLANSLEVPQEQEDPPACEHFGGPRPGDTSERLFQKDHSQNARRKKGKSRKSREKAREASQPACDVDTAEPSPRALPTSQYMVALSRPSHPPDAGRLSGNSGQHSTQPATGRPQRSGVPAGPSSSGEDAVDCRSVDDSDQQRLEAEWYARLAANPRFASGPSRQRSSMGSLRGAFGTGGPRTEEVAAATPGESWRMARVGQAIEEEEAPPPVFSQPLGAVGAGLLAPAATSAWRLPPLGPGVSAGSQPPIFVNSTGVVTAASAAAPQHRAPQAGGPGRPAALIAP